MASFDLILEYNEWARRGYVEPIKCPQHDHIDLIPDADREGLILLCGLCEYSIQVGLATERSLESKVKMAKFLFARET